MGAPMKCKCGSRWYGMGSTHCHDCGSSDIDVDFAFYLREQYKDHKKTCRKRGEVAAPSKAWKAEYLNAAR